MCKSIRLMCENSCNLSKVIVSYMNEGKAMMSHRPYRPALGLEMALEEIRKNSGTCYNAEVVAACISLFNEDYYAIDDCEHKVLFPL